MFIMIGMQPTLLVGPADWDPAVLPRGDYDARLAALWRDCEPGIGGAVIFGDPAEHAELAYFCHFTPKLEPAIALIPRQGAARLLVGGGVNMLPAAKPLTFIETLLPLRDVGPGIAKWIAEHGNAVLINGGAMPYGMRQGLSKALGAEPAEHSVASLMRPKSARERGLLQAGCATLEAALAAMATAQRSGAGLTDAVLAGEHVAHRRGAQDVRTLFCGDGRQFAPFSTPVTAPAETMHVYMAVRHGGYWVEGFAVLSNTPSSAGRAADAALDRALALTKPGVAVADLDRAITAGSPSPHPMAQPCCRSLGLPIDNPGERIEAGGIYSVRAGGRDAAGAAMVSAVVAVTATGYDLLWSSPKGTS
jgi:hypothetical protein